jgi:hypothetical protein
MRHQEIVTSTTPWLVSANCANPDGDMSTTRGYPACSRSSTVHVVLAPVETFVTVTTVPKGSVGLAHLPGGAAAYHVAWPRSLFPVVVGRGALTDVTFGVTVVVVTGGEACTTAGVSLGVVVGAVEGATVGGVTGAVVVVVALAAAASYLIIRVGSTTLYNVEARRAPCAATRFPPVATRAACADPCCSKRRGATNTPPQRTAATPRRLP